MRGAILTLLIAFATKSANVLVPANLITPSLLERDSQRYMTYVPSDTAEALIAHHERFDPAHNSFVVAYHPPERLAGSQANALDPIAEIKRLSWNSDAIVIGTPTQRISAITSTHRFVFSDFAVTINSVLKKNDLQIADGSQVIVTRPGGAVTIDGEQFRAIDTEFPLFRFGSQYIFFLHFNRDNGSFSVSALDVFSLEGNQVSSIKLHPRIYGQAVREDVFLNDLQSALDLDTRGAH